jgi:hypothetical protein
MDKSMQDKDYRNQMDWVETRRKIKNRWNKLSSDQLDELEDQQSLLPEQLMKTYGFSKEFAKSESDSFFMGVKQKTSVQEPKPLGHTDHVSSPRMSRQEARGDHFPHDRSPFFDDQP